MEQTFQPSATNKPAEHKLNKQEFDTLKTMVFQVLQPTKKLKSLKKEDPQQLESEILAEKQALNYTSLLKVLKKSTSVLHDILSIYLSKYLSSLII